MKKFGCICPSVINLPWDLAEAIAPDLAVAAVTLNVRNGMPGEQERAISIMRGATDVLIDEGCEAIVVMGVPVSARRGFAAEREALNALTADRGAVPITSALAASALALRGRGVRRPLLVTQYAMDVNALLIEYYAAAAGLEPAGAVGLGAGNAAQVNALKTRDFYDLARRAFREHDADGIFLSARGNMCANAAELEREFGVPVLDQILAAVWWARAELGAPVTSER